MAYRRGNSPGVSYHVWARMQVQAEDLRTHGMKPDDLEVKDFVLALSRVDVALSYGVKPWNTEEMENSGRALAGHRRWETRRENEAAKHGSKNIRGLNNARRSYDHQQRASVYALCHQQGPSAFERRYTQRREGEALSYGVKPEELENLDRALAEQHRRLARWVHEAAKLGGQN